MPPDSRIPNTPERKIARAAQRDRAPGDTSRSYSRSCEPQGTGQWGAIQAAAPSVRIEVSAVNVRNADEIERAVTAFARSSNGGLIVTGERVGIVHRKLIIELAARHKLPAVYAISFFVTDGGLISYGADRIEPHRRAAAYVDRISRARSPAIFPCRRQLNTSW